MLITLSRTIAGGMFLAAVLGAGLVSAAPAPAASPARPNVLSIMADDHAAHAVSAYGSKVNQTPQIDRLARGGLKLNNCFVVNAVGTPSRAAILTGKYRHLNGMPVFNRFDGSQPTVAKYLQGAGYYTGMIGKWHLFSGPPVLIMGTSCPSSAGRSS